MPLMAFTQLVRDAAIRLTSIDLCHPLIPLTIIVFLDTLEHIFIPSQYYSEIKNAISAVDMYPFFWTQSVELNN